MNLAEKVRGDPRLAAAGVGFKDITPLLADPASLAYTVEQLVRVGAEKKPDLVLGAEARGFILGAAIAKEIGCGFVPARRPGKLPPETISADVRARVRAERTRAAPGHDPDRGAGPDPRRRASQLAEPVEAIAEQLIEQLDGIVVGLLLHHRAWLPQRSRPALKYDLKALIEY